MPSGLSACVYIEKTGTNLTAGPDYCIISKIPLQIYGKSFEFRTFRRIIFKENTAGEPHGWSAEDKTLE